MSHVPKVAGRHRHTAGTAEHRPTGRFAASAWSLLHDAAAPLGILIAGALTDLAANSLLGRILGPEDYGDYAVAVSAALICAGLAELGADETLPRFLPRYLEHARFRLAAGILRGHLAVNMAVAITIAAVFAVFYDDISRVSFNHPLALIWLVVPLITLSDYLFDVLITIGVQTQAMVLETIVFPSILIGTVYGMVRSRIGMTDKASVVAFGIAVFTLALMYFALARGHLPARVQRTSPAYDTTRWTRFGVAVALSGLAFAAYTQLSLQLVEFLPEDERNVGRFAAATKIADLVMLASMAVHIIILPRAALLFDEGTQAAIQRFIGGITAAVLLAAGVLAAFVIAFQTPLTRLFGEGFAGAGGPLVVLALGNFALAPLSFAWTYLSLSGHEREPVLPIVVGFCALTISTYLSVPYGHIVAAAICKVAVGLGVYGWMAFRVWRLLGVRMWQLR